MKRSLQLNPDNRPAIWIQIKQWRDTHELAPVQTQYGIFDCDEKADKRLYEQLDLFDYLITLNSDGTLNWKLADNSWIALTKDQLAQVYHEIRVGRAKRAGLLHVKAAEFEAMKTKPLIKNLKIINYWLE